MPGKNAKRKKDKGQIKAHVNMAATNVAQVSSTLGGRVSSKMIENAAKRHQVPESDVITVLRKRGLIK